MNQISSGSGVGSGKKDKKRPVENNLESLSTTGLNTDSSTYNAVPISPNSIYSPSFTADSISSSSSGSFADRIIADSTSSSNSGDVIDTTATFTDLPSNIYRGGSDVDSGDAGDAENDGDGDVTGEKVFYIF